MLDLKTVIKLVIAKFYLHGQATVWVNNHNLQGVQILGHNLPTAHVQPLTNSKYYVTLSIVASKYRIIVCAAT